MRLLMYAKGAVVSKETMLLKIWGDDGEAVDNNVEIYISFLRKKLTFLKASASIVTARHLGYYLGNRLGQQEHMPSGIDSLPEKGGRSE